MNATASSPAGSRQKLPPHGYEHRRGLPRVATLGGKPLALARPPRVAVVEEAGFAVVPLDEREPGPVRMTYHGQPCGVFASAQIAAGTRRILNLGAARP